MPTSTDERTRSGSPVTTVTVGLLVLLVIAAFLAFANSGSSARTGPAAVDLPAGREQVSTPLAVSDPVGIEIPSIGVKADSIMDLGLNEDRSLQVPSDAKTIGWYTRGSSPGQQGPAVFASHVNYRGVEGGFANLKDVEAGDQVLVKRADGTTAAFVVDRVDQVSKGAFPTAQVYGPTSRPEIRLITCGGAFDSDTRNYEDNIVVHGHLTEAYRG